MRSLKGFTIFRLQGVYFNHDQDILGQLPTPPCSQAHLARPDIMNSGPGIQVIGGVDDLVVRISWWQPEIRYINSPVEGGKGSWTPIVYQGFISFYISIRWLGMGFLNHLPSSSGSFFGQRPGKLVCPMVFSHPLHLKKSPADSVVGRSRKNTRDFQRDRFWGLSASWLPSLKQTKFPPASLDAR